MSTMALLEYLHFQLQDNRPSSLLACVGRDGRTVDGARYRDYIARRCELNELLLKVSLQTMNQGEKVKKQPKKPRTRRSCKALTPYYFNAKGEKILLRPRQTYWYMMYVMNPALDNVKFIQKFRRRFRMSYSAYAGLVERVMEDELFQRWHPTKRNRNGNVASPIELLLLGALRYLGRGLTFDDLEEYTAISEETHRQFLHKFTEFGSTRLYDAMVKMPTTVEEYKRSQRQYDIGGLTGAGFSTDATNVVMWRCAHNLKQANTGFKQTHPARTYNLSTNHNRRILHSTRGHASRWNDKTLAHFDDFMCAVHEGKILQDVTFTLYSWEGEIGRSNLEATKYCGAWGLVDNGYHRWSCTQAPAKHSLLRTEERLSEWIESFRKDAECTFGILKGRFRVLKTGIRLDGPEAADKVWLTCCALHNMLLSEDGLDDWSGEMGLNDIEDFRHAPFALQRLGEDVFADFGSRQHEQLARDNEIRRRRAEGEDTDGEDENFEQENDVGGPVRYGIGGAVVVNSLSYDDFRNRLVEHFDILHRKQRVKWPVQSPNNT
jgi:DDE superfamily endonuclease